MFKRRPNFLNSALTSTARYGLWAHLASDDDNKQPFVPFRCTHRSCMIIWILTVPSQYILSLKNFVLQNQERFTPNTEVHNFNTRNKLTLHKPVSSLTLYQKGVCNMWIRVFNKLPEHVTNLAGNKKIFISTLSQYLVRNALYSLD